MTDETATDDIPMEMGILEPTVRLEMWEPAEGRNVVYQIADGEWRPAQIVRVWTKTGLKTCNLLVFLDGANDDRFRPDGRTYAEAGPTLWLTSRYFGSEVGQYLTRKPEPFEPDPTA